MEVLLLVIVTKSLGLSLAGTLVIFRLSDNRLSPGFYTVSLGRGGFLESHRYRRHSKVPPASLSLSLSSRAQSITLL